MIRIILALMIGSFPAVIVSGQQSQTLPPSLVGPRIAKKPEETKSKGELQAKRNEVAKEMNSASRKIVEGEKPITDPAKQVVSQELDLLKQIDAVLARQQNAKSRKTQLQQQLQSVVAAVDELNSAPNATEDIGFHEFDKLNAELASVETRLQNASAQEIAANELIVNLKSAKSAKEAAQRKAKELATNETDPEKKAELEIAAKKAELETRLASEQLTLAEINAENEKLNRQIVEKNGELLKAQVDSVKGHIQFSDSDLQSKLVEIQRLEQETRDQIRSTELQQNFAIKEWTDARERISKTSPTPELEAELEAKTRVQQLRQIELEFLNLKLQRLAKSRETWTRRFKVFNKKITTAEMSEWANETREQITELERERNVQILASDDLRKEFTSIESRRSSVPAENESLRNWLQIQLNAISQIQLVHSRNLATIDDAISLNKDLQAEIQGDIDNWTFGERIDAIWAQLVKLWNTEIANIDDRPITIGKIVIGLAFFLLGFVAARIFSRIIGNRLLTRFGLNEGASAAIKSISFYTLIVIFTLLALRFANVPLTVFTLLGGALAIGVGFGSQAIINNFISGLILLAERPIQVGDLVKLDNLVGNVTHIGARSTRVRTGNNLDIIVPNSKFLENNVLNYTLGDDKFRTHVSVGIAYGSPTRDATKLLIKTAEEHGLILNNPKPFVWFRDFGDNSLVFELHVWIKVRTLGERLRIESDLRYRIDQLFREAHIEIAFPQRDVHLDIKHPLQVQMSPDPNRPSEAA